MDAFLRYAKKPHVMEDIKGTFECSAKFKYPKPSETQVRKFFDEEMTSIMSNFYEHLKSSKPLVERPDKEFEECNKGIDQSDIIVEFDSWLDRDENEFTYVEKEKEKPKPHAYPHPTHPLSHNPSAFTPHTAHPSHAFIYQQQQQQPYNGLQNAKYPPTALRNPPPPPPPTPELKAQQQPTFLVEKPSPAVKSLAPQIPHATHYPQIRPPVVVERGEEKPYRTRFIEKMAEFLDCPERMNIIKCEINGIMSRK